MANQLRSVHSVSLFSISVSRTRSSREERAELVPHRDVAVDVLLEGVSHSGGRSKRIRCDSLRRTRRQNPRELKSPSLSMSFSLLIGFVSCDCWIGVRDDLSLVDFVNLDLYPCLIVDSWTNLTSLVCNFTGRTLHFEAELLVASHDVRFWVPISWQPSDSR